MDVGAVMVTIDAWCYIVMSGDLKLQKKRFIREWKEEVLKVS
jgi:hypothetical protein